MAQVVVSSADQWEKGGGEEADVGCPAHYIGYRVERADKVC